MSVQLVNQMQRDLASSHVLEVCAALIAVTNLITADMAPAVHTEVGKALEHQAETVRKKAIIALHRLNQIAPDVVTRSDVIEKLRKVLCDRDPAVMGASLNAIESMAAVDPIPFKDLIPSLISILKQVCERRLPDAFEYHKVPAPWIQMKLVRILASLGKNDAQASNGMYEILSDCLKRADVGVNAGYAVMYECVRTITTIYPNPTLLDAAADAISRLLGSRAQNLRYLGLTGLAGIVEGHPKYAAAHQMAVIECLEDTDETIQRKTLDLLYKMTNPVNVEFVVDKLLLFIRTSQDLYLRKTLTSRICTIAERFAPSNAWYVKTITELFEISGEFVSLDVAQNLMSLIAEGSGEGEDGEDSEEADMLLRQHAVEIYAAKLAGPKARLPRVLVETMAWVLGEYAYLSASYTLDDILVKLCEYSTTPTLDTTTRKFLITAIQKLVAQMGQCPSHAASVIDAYTKSKDVDLQQRCMEFQAILTTAPHLLSEILPVDASCEDVGVDENLSFLDGFVSEALQNGAKAYEKPEDDDDDDDAGGAYASSAGAFKMTPYEKPTSPAAGGFSMRGVGSSGPGGPNAGVALPPGAADAYNHGGAPMAQTNPAGNSGEPQLVLRGNVANVWGKGGLSQPGPAAAPAPPPAPAPAPVAAAPAPASSYGGYGVQPAAAPAPAPAQKTAAQLEKGEISALPFLTTTTTQVKTYSTSYMLTNFIAVLLSPLQNGWRLCSSVESFLELRHLPLQQLRHRSR
jgi:AP-4 complex subunit epsilon-1